MEGGANTRLIVKNLPKHLSDDRFRAHFAKKGDVTDCKIVRNKSVYFILNTLYISILL